MKKGKNMATLRQKLTASKIGETGGNLSKAMRLAGYSPTTDVSHLTESKGWQELMDKHLPDNKIVKKIEEGMEATKIHSSHTEPDRLVPDYQTQHRFTETALKIKGRLKDNPVGEDAVNMVVFNIYENSSTNGLDKSAAKTINGSTDSI